MKIRKRLTALEFGIELGRLPGVTLLNMDDLKAFAEAGVAERRKEISAVERIIAEEVDRFVETTVQREMAPLVAALRDRAEGLRMAELQRFRMKLKDLDAREREAVEALTRGILAKVLHEPTVQLKQAAVAAVFLAGCVICFRVQLVPDDQAEVEHEERDREVVSDWRPWGGGGELAGTPEDEGEAEQDALEQLVRWRPEADL